jgi:hypothetical protein
MKSLSLSPAISFYMNFPPKAKHTKAAHEWLDYLRDSEGLGGILAKTEDLAKLKLGLNRALSALNLEHFSPKIEAGWRSSGENELFLLVASASIANRLQQILPSLINELSKNGVRCRTIKVRLKPPAAAWEVKHGSGLKQTNKPRGFNEVARKSWENLKNQLEPDSELRKAVERLLQNKSK